MQLQHDKIQSDSSVGAERNPAWTPSAEMMVAAGTDVAATIREGTCMPRRLDVFGALRFVQWKFKTDGCSMSGDSTDAYV